MESEEENSARCGKAFPAVTTDTGQDAPPLLEPTVLVIEDDVDAAHTLQDALRRSGMHTVVAHSGAEAVSLKKSLSPQVVLVDLDLPDVNGETLIRWLVEQNDCGIIVVSGHGDEPNRVLSLELGADDYIAKPPLLRELVARVRAVYRRSRDRGVPSGSETEPSVVKVGDFTVDLRAHQIRDSAGRPIEATAAEFAVMAALIEARGLPVSRERLAEAALHRSWHAEDRGVDQLILGLRRKLSAEASGRRLIQSIRNAGYALILSGGPES